MSMSESEIERVVDELGGRLVGQALAQVWQPARDHVVLGFQDGTRLLLVPRGPDARLHTLVRRPSNPQRPFSFQGACRAHLSGALRAITTLAGERVVDLQFGAHRLHLRLTGRSGGLWLLDGDRVVAAYDGPAPAALPELPPRPTAGGPPRFAPGGDGSWDLAAARWFEDRIRERRSRELRSTVARALGRAIGRAARLLANLEDDLDKASGADAVRERADALAAHLHEVPRGVDHVDLPAFDDPGRLLRVPLDPARDPVRSMELLYQKARRLDRMGDRVLDRMESVSTDLHRLRALLATVDTLDLDTLDALRRTHAPAAGDPARHRALPGITTWVGPREQRVLVGRDAKANRRLTFQVARGTDWWMHLRGRPGAHLVIPLHRDQTPPLELLLAAAQIALVQAGLPTGASAEIQYTRVRDVRSIPGSPGALVRVFNESVLHVARDPAELVGWTRVDPEPR